MFSPGFVLFYPFIKFLPHSYLSQHSNELQGLSLSKICMNGFSPSLKDLNHGKMFALAGDLIYKDVNQEYFI